MNRLNNQKGFGIVEVIITTFVFSIIAIIVATNFVDILNLQRRGFAAQIIQEESLFAIESMSREIRVSQIQSPDDPTCSLTSLTIESRIKEIGIRKVFGASISSILGLISKQFIKWVILAIIIAIPAAYYLTNNWLQEFAYRIEITWWMFALAGGLALIIALITVSIQAIKTAMANPVESLRYE